MSIVWRSLGILVTGKTGLWSVKGDSSCWAKNKLPLRRRTPPPEWENRTSWENLESRLSLLCPSIGIVFIWKFCIVTCPVLAAPASSGSKSHQQRWNLNAVHESEGLCRASLVVGTSTSSTRTDVTQKWQGKTCLVSLCSRQSLHSMLSVTVQHPRSAVRILGKKECTLYRCSAGLPIRHDQRGWATMRRVSCDRNLASDAHDPVFLTCASGPRGKL